MSLSLWRFYEACTCAGKCNKAMSSKLKKHTARSSDETEDDFEDDMGGDDLALEDDGNASPADPRWDALKGFIDE